MEEWKEEWACRSRLEMTKNEQTMGESGKLSQSGKKEGGKVEQNWWGTGEEGSYAPLPILMRPLIVSLKCSDILATSSLSSNMSVKMMMGAVSLIKAIQIFQKLNGKRYYNNNASSDWQFRFPKGYIVSITDGATRILIWRLAKWKLALLWAKCYINAC